MSRRVALLVATYEYQDQGLRRLTAPGSDAESLEAVLRDPDVAGFEVTTLVNRPHHEVGEAIGDFFEGRRRNDLALLYFTGHGLKDDDGRLYLAMSNTRRESLLFTALAAEQLDHALNASASRNNVLILDCCYSGAFPAGRSVKGDDQVHTLERLQGRGRTVLTASDSMQYSFEGDRISGGATQSVFTRFLVEGLRDGSADLDGDGDITLDELYSYVHDRVIAEEPRQRPKKQTDVEGRIVIARNVNWSLPVYLRNAIASPIPRDRLAALDGLVHLHRIGNPTVRQRVVDELTQLVDDDSKIVSTTAAQHLEALATAAAAPRVTQPAAEGPRRPDPEPARPMPTVEAPRIFEPADAEFRGRPTTDTENRTGRMAVKRLPFEEVAATSPKPPSDELGDGTPAPVRHAHSARAELADLAALGVVVPTVILSVAIDFGRGSGLPYTVAAVVLFAVVAAGLRLVAGHLGAPSVTAAGLAGGYAGSLVVDPPADVEPLPLLLTSALGLTLVTACLYARTTADPPTVLRQVDRGVAAILLMLLVLGVVQHGIRLTFDGFGNLDLPTGWVAVAVGLALALVAARATLHPPRHRVRGALLAACIAAAFLDATLTLSLVPT